MKQEDERRRRVRGEEKMPWREKEREGVASTVRERERRRRAARTERERRMEEDERRRREREEEKNAVDREGRGADIGKERGDEVEMATVAYREKTDRISREKYL
jgi:hypothetical protein